LSERPTSLVLSAIGSPWRRPSATIASRTWVRTGAAAMSRSVEPVRKVTYSETRPVRRSESATGAGTGALAVMLCAPSKRKAAG